MPHDRFYVDAPLNSGSLVILATPEAHHLSQVMRARVGAMVELVNGLGVLASAQIHRLDRHTCELRILNTTTHAPDPFPLILAQAIPRMNRLDTIVEKGTELGMHALWLFPGERSERPELSDQQRTRLQAIMISAMKRCGRLDLPKVEWRSRLDDWEPVSMPAFFGTLSDRAPLFSTAWSQHKPQAGAIFLVGPEAGFSSLEETRLQQLGATGVTLHANTLRVDTAPLVALSLMSHWRLKEG